MPGIQERIIHTELVQGTEEWFMARLGRVTASEFQTLLAKGKGGKPSKGRETYMHTLMAERLSGLPQDTYTNHHMERGKELEGEARALYELTTMVEVQQVGFISMGDDLGYSPDGLVNSNGLVEIKTRLGKLQVPLLLADLDGKGEVPPENMAQCQGGLWVAEREWIDYVSYSPNLPIFIKRVQRDEKMIRDIKVAVDKFLEAMDKLLAKLR